MPSRRLSRADVPAPAPYAVTVATYFVRPLRRFLAARGVDASRGA